MTDKIDIDQRSERLKDYLPITLFIVLTFLLEAFGLEKATNLVVAVFISLFVFGVNAAMLREKFGDLEELKPLQKKVGWLSLMLILIIGNAILHWYQIFHVDLRWILFFVFLILYFIILFRAVSALHTIKKSLMNQGNK
jgi:hypothetical protein